jgi:RNA polymerase sigma-70 factor, ECF subfamily
VALKENEQLFKDKETMDASLGIALKRQGLLDSNAGSLAKEASLSDEALASKVQNGDVEAFDVLLSRYHNKILRYGTKFLLGHQDIEDVTQEVFLKAYRFIKSFNPERRFSPWIYRIAHNEFINVGKKRKGEPLDFFDFDTFFPHPSAKDDPAKDLDEQQIKNILDKCLDKLSAKYREPLVLYYLEGFDYKDIADVLKIPIATVGVRLSRAKKQLKEVSLKFKESI